MAAALVLLPMLSRSGVWDPYELDSADYARRIAIHAFGASDLALEGAHNGMPTLSDLRMGELPFTSMALSFRLFGLADWAGRLPLALWAFVGVMSLYLFLARLVSPRTGLYATLILLTTPLFFVQARTMLGDVVTMAALTMSFTGLNGALWDRHAGARWAWLVWGALGLVAGYLCRGALIGVAAPCLSSGAAFFVARRLAADDTMAPRRATALSYLGLGLLTAALGGITLYVLTTEPNHLVRVVGTTLLPERPREGTFDLVVRQLGHAMFPWSALLPFAIGRLFVPPAGDAGDARSRDAAVRVALLLGLGTCWAAYTLMVPHAGNLAFGGCALCAAVVAVSVTDLERGAHASPLAALGTVLLVVVLYRDFARAPDVGLAPFVVADPSFPESFVGDATSLLWASTLVFAGFVGLAWYEKTPAHPPKSFGAWARAGLARYRDVFRELADVWQGNLLFAFVVVEAGLVGLALMLYFGGRFGWAPVAQMPRNLAGPGVNAWWALPIVLATGVPIVVVVRDAFRWGLAWARLPRASATVIGGVLAGAMLSFGYYPALASQLSPREVFEAYGTLAERDAPLALLGVGERGAAYYHRGTVQTPNDPASAVVWMGPPTDERRWLIATSDDLPRVNSLFRARHGRNVPVLDARSSQILLLSNRLEPGEVSQSWLDRMVLDQPMVPERALHVRFRDQLECLGWEITDEDGQPVDRVLPQQPYTVSFYFRVLAHIPTNWRIFVHVDGHKRRHNADHDPLEGRYPMRLWQPGDFVRDSHVINLEPNFTPGSYGVYFGFYSGKTRFAVTEGTHDDNRVRAGVLRVR